MNSAERQLARDAVTEIAAFLARSWDEGGPSPGERAELRRLDPHAPLPPAMWRLLTANSSQSWLDHLDRHQREGGERALAVLASAVVEAVTLGDAPIGAALARTAYAEPRFTRLLRARGLNDVAHEAWMAARWCGIKGAGLSFRGEGSFGLFILNAATDRREADRYAHAIARDYYATLHQQNETESEDA